MKFLELLKIALALIPNILTIIKSLEEALPTPGNGASKLVALKELLAAAYNAITDIKPNFESLWPIIEKIVAAAVGFYNSVGIFRK